MDRTGVVLLALVPVIVTCGPLSCVIFAKIRRHRKSHPGLRQLANARNQLTAVGGCSNSLGAERLAGSGWGTLGDRSTTTASDIGVGVGVGVGADGVLVESRTPQEANSSCPICLGSLSSSDTNIDVRSSPNSPHLTRLPATVKRKTGWRATSTAHCSGVGRKCDAAPETVQEDKYAGKAHDSTSIAAKTHFVPAATGLATSLSPARLQTTATASAEHTVPWSQAGSAEGNRLGRRREDDDITAAPPSPPSPIRMTRGNCTEAEGRDSRPVLSAMPDDTGSAKEGGARQGPLLHPDHGPSLLTNDNNHSRWPSFTFCGFNAKNRERSLEHEILVLRGCRHSFHARCLTSWFLQDGFNCPLCRTPFWMQPDAMARAVQRPSNAGLPHGGSLQA